MSIMPLVRGPVKQWGRWRLRNGFQTPSGEPGALAPGGPPGANTPGSPIGKPLLSCKRWGRRLFFLLLAAYLLFCHGCHGDEDNELFMHLAASQLQAPVWDEPIR
jgi:hypothetical protein